MEPTRVCLECGQSFRPGERRLYCDDCAKEPTAFSAIATTFGTVFAAAVIMLIVVWVFFPPSLRADSDLPRWAVVKWQRGIPLQATFEPKTEAECKDIAAKRSAAYAHAGVEARWTCVDLSTMGDKQA